MATWPDDFSADVYIATVDQLLRWAPECRTLYLTCDIQRDELHIISSLMPVGGALVMCKLM